MALDSEANIQTEKKALVEAYFNAAEATLEKKHKNQESRLCELRHRELLLRDILPD